MANATDIVKRGTVRKTDEFLQLPLAAAAAERTFYPNAMLGYVDGTGYVTKFDDAVANLRFVGLVRGDQGDVVQPISSNGDYDIDIHQPQRFELAVSGVAQANLGDRVYASDDQTGSLSATTNSNLVGVVVAVVATDVALVEPIYPAQRIFTITP